MTPEQWQQVKLLFDECVDLSPERRGQVLHEQISEEIRSEVLRLLENFASAGESFLQVPAISPSSSHCLQAGDVLGNRFRIGQLLGAGGMGEVYEAFDEEIGETVALKVIHPSHEKSAEVAARFRRELQFARRVTHPNVCRLFDLGRHDGAPSPIDFFTMELVKGETIDALLSRKGPVPPTEALVYLDQILQGLEAVHAAGITHRDLKPSNVMVVPQAAGAPRVVLMDFGLARQDPTPLAGTALTRSQEVLGTLAYMAPEQRAGGMVSPRTDLYAFGIIMFELLRGARPFDRLNSEAGPADQARSMDVPEAWRDVIERCLHADPQRRPESAARIRQILLGTAQRPPVGRSRRWWIGSAAVAAGGVALFPSVSRLFESSAGLEAGGKILVTPLVNTTGDARFNALTVTLQASLVQSAHLNLWNDQRLSEVRRSMRLADGHSMQAPDWRQVAIREAVPLVVFSSLSSLGSGYVLAAQCELIGATPEPVRRWSRSFSAEAPNALFEAIHEAARWVREIAGEDAVELSRRNRLPQDITSSRWEALELFDHAQTLASVGQASEAIPFLRRAVEIDAEFAMGFMRLGDILNSQRKQAEGYAAWREAIRLARLQHLSEHESFNIEARYLMEVGDYAAAEPILRDWTRRYAHDPLAVQLLASCLLDLGQFPEGVAIVKEAEARFGPTYFGQGTLFRGLAATNRLAEIESQLPAFEALAPPLWRFQLRGFFEAMRRNAQAARHNFERVRDAEGREAASRGTGLLAILAADQGDFEQARKLLRDGLERDRQAGEEGFASRKATGLAFLEGIDGNREAARTWSEEAISSIPSPRVLTLSACCLARFGFSRRAKEILAAFPSGEGSRYRAGRLRIEGEIAAAEGRVEDALTALQNAARLETAFQVKEYLGRALAAAGQEPRAVLVYSNIAKSPYLIWDNPESEWPGIGFLARKYLQTSGG